MKRPHVPRDLAPAPRLTLWVPGLIAGGLSLVWLGLWALV